MPGQLTPGLIAGLIGAYFVMLIIIARFTSGDGDNKTFFTANRSSPWYLVAFGMIGASLSGVTFISIPGAVGAGGVNQALAYMQIVFGYLFGYLFIAFVLLPVYYRMNLISIYGYLNNRFGKSAQITGSFFFLISRVIGASFRLYLVAIVLDFFVMRFFGISFAWTVLITIALIWVYTFRGGIKTIVITDTVQTTGMLLAIFLTLFGLARGLEISWTEIPGYVMNSEYGQLLFFENGWSDPNNFFKHFLAGMFITIVMTGLDQDMMQKNLTCHSLKDAQRNMISLGAILIPVNFLVLLLGAMLYLYAANQGIALPERADHVFPTIALNHMPGYIGILFILGLIAAAYSSADSALTSLTTSFCVDILNFKDPDNVEIEQAQRRTRFQVHLAFSVVLFLQIMIFKGINNDSVINDLFKIAGYTYGPLLGLFVFGLLSDRQLRSKLIYPICVIAPALTYLLNRFSEDLLAGYKFGFELLLVNGLLTLLGLFAISQSGEQGKVESIN